MSNYNLYNKPTNANVHLLVHYTNNKDERYKG